VDFINLTDPYSAYMKIDGSCNNGNNNTKYIKIPFLVLVDTVE
jgi:hypothetical protein